MQWKNKFYHFWLYFKTGRNEIGTFYGVINTLILLSMKFDLEVSIIWGVAYTVGFIFFSVLAGVFLKREVEPQNNMINPFALDGIMSAISLQKAFVAYWEGEEGEAIELMEKAIQYREKWIK